MAVTDPVAVRFLGEQVRPNAEATRAAFAQLQGFLAEWAADGGARIPQGGGPIEDGRQDPEGVAQVTADEVRAFVALAEQLAAVAADPSNAAGMAALHKLCVRPPAFLRISPSA